MKKLPPATEGKNLTGVFTITRHPNYDEIRVGSKVVGDLCYETQWVGDAEQEIYCFYAYDTTEPFPVRNSYEECWVDILTTIANNQTLAIEFTIKVNQKVKKDISIDSIPGATPVHKKETANV
jgi:hypothetical protein